MVPNAKCARGPKSDTGMHTLAILSLGPQHSILTLVSVFCWSSIVSINHAHRLKMTKTQLSTLYVYRTGSKLTSLVTVYQCKNTFGPIDTEDFDFLGYKVPPLRPNFVTWGESVYNISIVSVAYDKYA